MPTYDYTCANCGHVVEVIHGVHDPGPTICPQCGGLLRKRISLPAIHFSGTGWAKKDARQAAASRSGTPGKPGKPDGHGKAGADEDGTATSSVGSTEPPSAPSRKD